MFVGFSEKLNFGSGGGTATMIPSTFPILPIGQMVNYHPLAQQFLATTGITDPTIQSAIYQLTFDLSNSGLLNKLAVIYPFVGGTASTHRINLKDPRDTDAAFRLNFFGGITHSSTGVFFNGSNGYADTQFIPPSTMNNNMSFALYSTRNVTSSNFVIDMGAIGSSVTGLPGGSFYIRRGASGGPDLGAVFFNSASTNGAASGLVTDPRGFFIGTITQNNLRIIYRDSITLGTTTTVVDHVVYPFSIWIGSCGVAGVFSSSFPSLREIAFASIGFGLLDSDVRTLTSIVQSFQTKLGRNI